MQFSELSYVRTVPHPRTVIAKSRLSKISDGYSTNKLHEDLSLSSEKNRDADHHHHTNDGCDTGSDRPSRIADQSTDAKERRETGGPSGDARLLRAFSREFKRSLGRRWRKRLIHVRFVTTGTQGAEVATFTI